MSDFHPLKKEPQIRKVYNPSGDERQTLKHVYDRYYKMKDNRTFNNYGNWEDRWDNWEKQWMAWRPPKDTNDWQSDIFIPITTSTVEAILSEVVDQELIPWVVERGAEDSAKAKVMNAILKASWENAKSNVALHDIMKDALIFGTGIGQEYYWRQPRIIKNQNGKDVSVFDYDDVYLEPVRLWDFFIDERARSFTGPYGAQDCIRRYIMDYDDFRTFFSGPIWDNMGNAEKVRPGGDINYYEFFKPPERMEKSHEVEVLWYWNKPDDLLCIVANEVAVTLKPNPYRHKQLPFVRAVDIKVPYQFYGKGEAELLVSIQEELNTLRRMVIDRNHLDIDKPVFVSDTLTIEDEDTIVRPHGAIPVGDVNAIKFPEYSDIQQSIFKSLDMLNDDRIRITGMDERLQGLATGGTATEAAILKEATLKRIAMKLWHIKNDTLIDIGRLRVENIMQFYSQPKLQEIVDDKDLAKAEAQKSVVNVDGKKYSADYRTIRLKDEKLTENDITKEPKLEKTKGYSFFTATPSLFLPERGGYDISFKATIDIPLSKPLQQQKTDEMYDRLSRNPAVDQWKLAEAELKSRDFDPDEFKKQEAPQTADSQTGIMLKKMVDLAGMENSEMMKGKPIPPTAYASVVHTQIHVQFMLSDAFKKDANNKVVQLFTNHVVGEIAAQHQRQGMTGNTAEDMQTGGNGGMGGGNGMGATMASDTELPSDAQVTPDMMQGGGDTQNVSGSQSQ